MRVHVVSLPHIDTTRHHSFCAYGGKLRRWPRMLEPYGHGVVFYGSHSSDRDTFAACEEYVPVVSPEDREWWFGGEWDESKVFDRWQADDPCWREMNVNAIAAIAARIEPGDAIAIVAGWCQEQIAQAFPNVPILEPFVGYPGVLPTTFRVFESHTWRSFVTAEIAARGQGTDDIRWFDAVIPNAYGTDEFCEPRDHDGYLLFVGRPTERKGLNVIGELAKHYPLKVAGQSDPQIPNTEYVGLVRGDEKAKLFAGAAAVLAPTIYHEPFGGVAVEAQMAGAPAITTDYGAFTETVQSPADGYRCTTLGEFRAACDSAFQRGLLSRQDIATRARGRWSLEAVAPLYDKWLRRIELLQGEGWYG